MEVTLFTHSVALRPASHYISSSDQFGCRTLPAPLDPKSLIPPIPCWDMVPCWFLVTIFFLRMVAKASSGESKRYSEKDGVRKQLFFFFFTRRISFIGFQAREDRRYFSAVGYVKWSTFVSLFFFQNAFLFSSTKELKTPHWTRPISTRNRPLQ